MANIRSQIKRNRQNERRRLRNRGYRGAARSAVRNAFAAMTAEEPSADATLAAIRALDKAAGKGAIHHRNAGRRKSRLTKRLSALGLQVPTGAAAPSGEAASQRAPKPEKTSGKASEAKPKTGAKKATTKKTARKAASKKSSKK